ncbi:MAG: hypothetical protein QGD94_04360, partial [Planctomycetia bacterium]|nr:hypothetical protein [Planctomycetia bacterium]
MNMKQWIGGVVVVALLLAFVGEASAIPAFARKYKTSCATCHEAFPRLNAVGESFRLNGFKFADDDLYIKDEPVEMGDDAYKKIWPKAIWPSDIPGQVPLSVLFTSRYTMDAGATKTARSQFEFPNTAKLLGAGSMGDNISFFFELVFDRSAGSASGAHHGSSSTATGTTTEVGGWLQFEDLLGTENAINLRVGTVGMHEMGLFIARDHNRLSVNRYLYSSWVMPAPTDHFLEEFGLEHDTDAGTFDGNPFMLHAQPGVEVNGFGRRWRYAIGVVNGNGDEFDDNNSEKDLYYQVVYKFGGLGFDGSGGPESDALSSSESWRDNSIMLSSFGHCGTSTIDITVTPKDGSTTSYKDKDRFTRIGFGILGKYEGLAVRGGYIFGRNNNPYGA